MTWRPLAMALGLGLAFVPGRALAQPAKAQPGPARAPTAASAAPAAVQPARPVPGDACAACHLDMGDDRLVKPAKEFVNDIHAAKGLGCVACHGGDGGEAGMEAMDPKKGFIGKPSRQQVAQVCGRCHANAEFMKHYNPTLRVDQVAEYATSVHGRRLKDLDDPKVATCVSCHTAHAISPPSDPRSTVHPLRVADTCGGCHADAGRMASYKIPTDQLAKYKTSVHWAAMQKGDLSSPTCNDCHGNHGAAPPGVAWVGNVCGQCHSAQGDLFGKSRHARAFADLGTPGCATCHSNHDIKAPTDELIGLGDKAVCSSCHAGQDAGGKSAAEMRSMLDRLRDDHDRARALLTRAEHAGIQVSQAQFDLNGAQDALVKARAAIHAFDTAAVHREAEPGLGIAAKASDRGLQALRELRFRRQGLAVSVVIVLALIGGLLLKIREVDRRTPPSSGDH